MGRGEGEIGFRVNIAPGVEYTRRDFGREESEEGQEVQAGVSSVIGSSLAMENRTMRGPWDVDGKPSAMGRKSLDEVYPRFSRGTQKNHRPNMAAVPSTTVATRSGSDSTKGAPSIAAMKGRIASIDLQKGTPIRRPQYSQCEGRAGPRYRNRSADMPGCWHWGHRSR